MPEYHQDAVIDHLNQYLDYNNRHFSLTSGYCHGFTLLWLHCMATNQEQWFYDTLHNIVSCKRKHDYKKISDDIEKFLSHAEWLQNSRHYVYEINQLDLDKLFELPKPFSLSYVFTRDQLTETLKKIVHHNEMICISSPTHTIGLFQKENKMYLYDSNYDEGYAKSFTDYDALTKELLDCLFIEDDLINDCAPIQINISSIPTQENNDEMHCHHELKKTILNHLLSQKKYPDSPGDGHLTNLFLACEAGDIEAVSTLLKKGSNPNIIYKNNWTCLQMSACKGYHYIVDLLIQHGGDPSIVDENRFTPLHFAAKFGHFECVKLLLQHNVNINAQDLKKRTPLSRAIANQHWDIVILLLANQNQKIDTVLSQKEIKLLKNHKHELAFAANQLEPQLDSTHFKKITHLFKKWTISTINFSLFTPKQNTQPVNDSVFVEPHALER